MDFHRVLIGWLYILFHLFLFESRRSKTIALSWKHTSNWSSSTGLSLIIWSIQRRCVWYQLNEIVLPNPVVFYSLNKCMLDIYRTWKKKRNISLLNKRSVSFWFEVGDFKINIIWSIYCHNVFHILTEIQCLRIYIR